MKLRDALVVLAGADLGVLAKAESERSKYASLGMVLIATVILVLDRALIITMQDVSGPRVLLYALPRLALAFVIGMVVSIPLTVQVFHSEITSEVKVMNEQAWDQHLESVENGGSASRLVEVQKDIADREAILRGEVPIASTPEVAAAQQGYELAVEIETADREAKDKAYIAMICEVEGAGGSHPDCKGIASDQPGRGDLYYARENEYHDALARWDSSKGRLAEAENALRAAKANAAQTQQGALQDAQRQAEIDLCGQAPASEPPAADPTCSTGLRAESADISKTLEAQRDPSAFIQRQGLAQQIRALMSLGNLHLWVAALFMVIELLPVTVKTFMAIKGPTQYDRVAKRLRDDEFDKIEADTQGQQAQREREIMKREQIRDDMLQREIQLGVTANEHVANEMGGILAHALENWSKSVKATLAAHPTTRGKSQSTTTQASTPFGLPDPDDI